MNTKLQFWVVALVVAIFSVQCSPNNGGGPEFPTSIESEFSAGRFALNGVELNYQESKYLSGSDSAPLVVVLHGASGSGSDNKQQLRHDAMIRIWHYFHSNNIKAKLLIPQCPTSRTWDELPADVSGINMSQCLKALIDKYVSDNHIVDRSRIYILGFSTNSAPAGGGGVWRLLSDYTDLFAGGMSVAADPDESIVAANVAKTPVLSIKNVTDAYAVSLALGSFSEEVVDAGGTILEIPMSAATREELCREAFSKSNLDWVLQHTKQ